MAQFLRVTIMSNGKPSASDVIINTQHIAMISPARETTEENPACAISGRGGSLQQRSLVVSGSIADITAALASSCIVAILSHNDNG